MVMTTRQRQIPASHQQPQERHQHPHDEVRDLLRLLGEYGLLEAVQVTPEGAISLPRPEGFSPSEVQALRERIRHYKEALVAYFSTFPKEDWPACFFDEGGQVLHCVRGHEYDLCRDGEGRIVCRCFYDLDFTTRKRIGKE